MPDALPVPAPAPVPAPMAVALPAADDCLTLQQVAERLIVTDRRTPRPMPVGNQDGLTTTQQLSALPPMTREAYRRPVRRFDACGRQGAGQGRREVDVDHDPHRLVNASSGDSANHAAKASASSRSARSR